MSGLEDLKTRLDYVGGKNQQTRMIEDKLKSLKKALLYSYQAATAILADGRQFRCLINPDKLKNDYDNKIISIPFEDICLNKDRVGKTSEGIEEIGLKAGDVFTWAETESDWIVYLQRLEETAYFRAEIRRCQYEVQINENNYKVYACGPSESRVDWRKIKETLHNEINYTLEMYITKNEETEEYLHRFSKIKLNGKPWDVEAVDNMSVEGIIIVALREDYSNTIEEAVEKEKEENKPEPIIEEIYIDGETLVYPYEEITYSIVGAQGGIWSVNNPKVKITNQNEDTVNLYIDSGRSGNFVLIYSREDADDIELSVTIDSL